MDIAGGFELRLAPMAGATNAPFRLVARECGAGRLTTEEIDARGLVEDNAHTRELARYLPEERPLSFQLLGGDPEVLAEAARRLEANGADGIDLNMGCPVAKIVAKGHGAALMRDPLRAAVIFRTVRKAVRVPFTIKIRGGWDDATINAPAIAEIAESEGIDGLTVHPRTRSQQYTGRAPWEIIAAVVAAVRLPVIGNGDVQSRADAAAMASATGCAGVMIGRGALGAPWIFGEHDATREGKARVIARHCALIEEHLPERIALIQLKKHLSWYSDGLPFAARMRPALFESRDAATAKRLFWDIWANVVDAKGAGERRHAPGDTEGERTHAPGDTEGERSHAPLSQATHALIPARASIP